MKNKELLLPLALVGGAILLITKRGTQVPSSPGSAPGGSGPRGVRNNNPGNLILTNIPWRGKIPNEQNTDGKFEQFTQVVYGVRAMMKDLITDIGRGDNTILKLMYQYAPPNENPTESYIRGIEQMTGTNRNTIINPLDSNFKKLVQAIANFENYGIKPLDYTIKNSVYEQAKSLI